MIWREVNDRRSCCCKLCPRSGRRGRRRVLSRNDWQTAALVKQARNRRCRFGRSGDWIRLYSWQEHTALTYYLEKTLVGCRRHSGRLRSKRKRERRKRRVSPPAHSNDRGGADGGAAMAPL